MSRSLLLAIYAYNHTAPGDIVIDMKIHVWNTVFSLIFIVLLVSGIGWLISTNRLFYNVPTRDIIFMTLAIARLVRLTTYDVITKFIRDAVAGPADNSLRDTLRVLVNCPWCTGLWYSYLVIFFYFATPYAWPVIVILAIAFVASFIQITSNLIGWSAERMKQQATNID